MAVLLTLHNLAYHGWVPAGQLDQLGLRHGQPLASSNPFGLDLLLAAIERSELVNTVSRGFAAEALTPAFGMGLDGALLGKGDRFFGILNGIDRAVWDPANDPATAAPYSVDDPAGKAACRRDLLGRLGFDPDDAGPVVGSIGRLDPQKGFDLLAGAVPALLDAGMRFVVEGAGHDEQAAPFRALAAAEPGRVAFVERFDRAMARQVYAGADLFAMPSRFEPCGLGQMIALRYGTPPIVRRTGGLADSVVDVGDDPSAGGTGFVFDEATPEALTAAVVRGARLRADDPAAWDALGRRAMAVDFGWDSGPAPRYLEAYRRALAIRRS
jgi:starch synthase